MNAQGVALLTAAMNLVTLLFVGLQTRALTRQTRLVAANLEYGTHQRLIDYLNEINTMIIDNDRVREIFADIDFIGDSVRRNPEISVQNIALAWSIFNRYEAAHAGYRLGVIKDDDWEIWLRRIRKDLKIPFIRTVWLQDMQNFDYRKDFRDLINDLL
ncbi:hypothetical protein [Nonomuraea sp. NPDC049625]|uniref:hypothetical protein n=1 Tax=Nonomuraea sp. NPDC049625 TaxID=3155775 RepID=UPI0034403DD1